MPPFPWEQNDNQGFDNRNNNWNNDWNRNRNNNRGNNWNNNWGNNSGNSTGNNTNAAAPRSAPPQRTPQRPDRGFGGPGVRAVNPQSIRNCQGRFTYIWLNSGQEFWFFPIQIWGNTVAGFRWDRRFGWTYTGISLNSIDMFTCTV